MTTEYQNLYEIATKMRQKSYAPYSKYTVGAAILCDDGEIICGCNVENSSFGLSICAERSAVFNAISNGKKHFKAIAIAGGKYNEPCENCTPCGACRQVLSEFGNLDVILKNRVLKLSELLPESFKL